ncbi:MAG TPA: hypothetical protein VEC57_05700 [Candidatus Limnocylindrales bacterium]|nr:hypothetical protein [Candidatus Limnocylindrales bacterium]
MRIRHVRLLAVPAVAIVVAAASSARADINDLVAFLDRAERMATVNEKVQATITVKDGEGAGRKAVLVLDPAGGGTQVFTQEETGWKSQTPLAWKQGKVVEKTGASEHAIGVDDPLAGTDLRGLDFFPFWKTDYSGAFISDENPHEKTVSLYAGKGQPYSLYVISFDKAKLVPRMIKFYKDSFSNLVRIRTDKDHVMVGSRPRPTKILVRDFATGSLRTYELEWKLLEDASAAG